MTQPLVSHSRKLAQRRSGVNVEAVESVLRRYSSVKTNHDAWNEHREDLARVMLPRRAGFVTEQIEGDQRLESVFDGTPQQAARGLANAVGAMLRPEGEEWVTVHAEDDDESEEAQVWLKSANEDLSGAFNNPKARFRQATGEVDKDLVVFGEGPMFIGESRSLRHLLFQSIHVKDAVPFFGEEGNPEGMFRMRKFTLRQAQERFGDRLSDNSKKKITEGNLDDKIKVLHAVLPRAEGSAGALLAKNLPFADLWIEYDEKKMLMQGGFHEFPFIIPRWDTSSGESGGRSPGMIGLPDSNTLQAMGETILVAGQRAADPPLFAPNDSSFDAANTYPGGISYYDVDTATALRGNPFFPLDSGHNLPITRDMQRDTREQVFAAFFKNVFNLPVGGPQMTAEEIRARKEEFIREIGPVFGRLESDYTAPMVERSFGIMLRGGGFDEIPEVLQGKNIRFEYESPVKRIKQQVEAAAASQWVREQIELATATGRPDALDIVNFDEYSRFTAEVTGLPHNMLNSREAIDALRQQRAAAQQAQQQMATIQQMASAAKDGASAVSTMTPEEAVA